jgi:hypothetical protein
VGDASAIDNEPVANRLGAELGVVVVALAPCFAKGVLPGVQEFVKKSSEDLPIRTVTEEGFVATSRVRPNSLWPDRK